MLVERLRVTPASTRASRSSALTSRMRSMPERSMVTPPSSAAMWPSSEVPAPKAMTGSRWRGADADDRRDLLGRRRRRRRRAGGRRGRSGPCRAARAPRPRSTAGRRGAARSSASAGAGSGRARVAVGMTVSCEERASVPQAAGGVTCGLAPGRADRYLWRRRGYGVVVAPQLPKLVVRVRFPLPAPYCSSM